MQNILLRLLEKRNIKETKELSTEEKETFDKWEVILSEGEISVEKILKFCQGQIKLIETQWKNLDNNTDKNERLILLHTVYSTLVNLIQAPQTEKDNLEKYLTELLKK